MAGGEERHLRSVQFVIANEVKQSHKRLIIKEIATEHTPRNDRKRVFQRSRGVIEGSQD